jgi:hypothetical protein
VVVLVAAPFAVFVLSGSADQPVAVTLVREAMGSQLTAASCVDRAGAVTCGRADGSVCRYRVFSGRAARRVGNLFRGAPRDATVAVLGRCSLHGRPDGGSVGYLTPAA